MKRIRIGKDIAVTWKVRTDGKDVPLDGSYILKMWGEGRGEHTVAYTLVGSNTISFTWLGSEQYGEGRYFLSLYREDSPKSIVDAPLVELVSHSWDEGGCREDDIRTECVSLGGNMRIGGQVTDVRVGGKSVVRNGVADIPQHPYLSLERLRKYLYRVTFDSLPEDDGNDGASAFGCSSYVSNGKLYRNLDFNYDNAASFIVRTRDFEGMSFVTGLNDGHMDDSLIAQLPYRMVDGRNNEGIMVSTHVLYNDWQWTGCGSRNISLTRLPYLVLSKVKSMATIEDDLGGILGNLYASSALLATGYLIQVLVTDGTTTYAILPPTGNGQSFVLQDITSNPKLANFRWVESETVERTDEDIQERPTGIERWNMMPCDLEDLRFTKAYENADRLSEFIGLRDTTKDSTDEELTAIYEDAHDAYLTRERDGLTWHTMHSVVYGDGMEELYVQENWDDNCVRQNIPADSIMDALASALGLTWTKTYDAETHKWNYVVGTAD